MNNTKTIFKSLLIMIVAISLFTVSCSKDEGGTKTPTTPTIQKISATQITGVIKKLGPLGDKTATDIDFSSMTEPTGGKADIIKGASERKSLAKVKETIKNALETPILQASVTVTFAEGGNAAAQGNNKDLVATIVFTAKSGYEFDTTITGGTKYAYNKEKKTATLTLNIKLPSSTQWEA